GVTQDGQQDQEDEDGGHPPAATGPGGPARSGGAAGAPSARPRATGSGTSAPAAPGPGTAPGSTAGGGAERPPARSVRGARTTTGWRAHGLVGVVTAVLVAHVDHPRRLPWMVRTAGSGTMGG